MSRLGSRGQWYIRDKRRALNQGRGDLGSRDLGSRDQRSLAATGTNHHKTASPFVSPRRYRTSGSRW
jgi:hypothetical protein